MSNLAARYSITIGGRLVAALLQAGMVAFLARSLGVDTYGTLAIVLSACVFLLSIADLGMTATALRMGREHSRERMISTISIWRAVVTVALVLTLVIAASLVRPQEILLWSLVGYYAAGEAAGDMAVAVYQGQLRPVRAVSLLAARRILALSPFLAGLGAPQAMVALALAGTTGFAVLLAVALRRGRKPTSIFQFIRGNLRLILATSGRNLANLDTFIVGVSSGTQLAALYGAAARLGNPVNLAIATLVQVTIPELASIDNRVARLKRFQRLTLPVVGFGLAVATSSIAAPWVIVFVFGSDFSGAAPVLAGVLIGAGISAVTQFYMSWFLASEMPSLIAHSSIPIGIFGLALLGLLAASVGTWGAAIAVVAWRGATFIVTFAAWRADAASINRSA